MDKIKELVSSTKFMSLVIGILVTGFLLFLKEGYISSAIYSLLIWLVYESLSIIKSEEIEFKDDNIIEAIDSIKNMYTSIKENMKLSDLYILGLGILISDILSIFI